MILLINGCQTQERNIEVEKENEAEAVLEENTEEEAPQSDTLHTLAIDITADDVLFDLDDFLKKIDGSYQYDEMNRTLKIFVNKDEYALIEGVNVLERNGEFLATDEIYFEVTDNGNIIMPVEFLDKGLQLPIKFGNSNVSFDWYGPTEKVGGPPESFNFEEWDVEKMVEYLSFLESPIKNAEVSTVSSHLPGAPRDYRNGFHEGIDWYDFASGGDINTETPIYAMAEGIVVRADHDYIEYESPEKREVDLTVTAELGETPEYIFDRLRGRQVWVQYPNGVMNRFAHLHDIPENIKVGDRVNAETVIGFVGNSGTSSAVNQDLTGLHLHQDLLIYGELFWKPLSQEEIREVLIRIWN